MQIFSWIGYVFGYLLWAFYELTKNYGIAIILFTIVLKIITFPFYYITRKRRIHLFLWKSLPLSYCLSWPRTAAFYFVFFPFR